METITQTILQISISMAAVIGLLLLLVPVWQKHYSARWRKIIWLVIAVRLLVPFSLDLPDAPVTLDVNLQQETTWNRPVAEQGIVVNQTPESSQTAAEQPILSQAAQNETAANPTPDVSAHGSYQAPVSRGAVLALVWIAGMAGFLLWHGVQYMMFRHKVNASVQPLDNGEWLLNRAGAELNLNKYPSAAVSHMVQGPMLTGFLKPVILLTDRIYGEQDLLLILRHELMHYKHHDLWYKLVLLMANAVHWFNPLVWMMNRQAGRDLEQVCDDNVVAGQCMAYRKAYSMTILNTMASQRGIALSTYLSKEAQNTKKRFTGILQPKQYKKGVIVLAGVILLAIAASGCLQIGNVDKGVEAYERVAEFLPEDAIHDPTVYEMMGEADDEYIWYIWIEGAYEVTKEEAREAQNDGALSYGRDGKAYLYDRALMLCIYQKDGSIVSMGYDNRQTDTVKPSEIGLDKEKRDNYVQKIAETLIDDGKYQAFTERHVATDADENAVRGTYTTGTVADIELYEIQLNYQYGYLEKFMYYGPEMWEQGRTFRQYDITIEGMTETVDLTMNRQPDYYVMFTDAEALDTQLNGISPDGSFCDEYVLHNKDVLIKTYMKVGFTPDCTVEQWMNRVETDSDYAKYIPQHNPLSSTWLPEWELTGEQKVFPEDTVRTWQVLSANRDGVINTCYVTPYRDGVMAAVLSYPAEYEEGWGTRMQQMMGTLVLAAREDNQPVSEQEQKDVAAIYKQVAEFLPKNAIQESDQYQRMTGENNTIGYLWAENPYEVTEEETYGKGLLCLHKNGKHYLYERALLVYVSETDNSIVSYDYDRKEDKPEKTAGLGANRDKQDAYLQKTAKRLIDGGEKLVFCDFAKNNQSYITSDGAQKYTALPIVITDDLADGYFISENTVNDNQYLLKLNYDYGYIEEFYSWYHDEMLQNQVENWLAVEKTRLYEEYYDINSFEAAAVEETRKDGIYTISLNFTMHYRNAGTADTNTYLNQLKEAGSPDYQRMYEDYDKPQQSTSVLRIEAEIMSGDVLNMGNAKLYTAVDGANGSMYWEEIPGLYVFFKGGESEVAGWNKEKTAALWAADNYLQAYVSQDIEGMKQFSMAPPVTTESQYLTGKGYTSMEPTGQHFRAHLVEQFKKQYGGTTAVHPETTVQLRLTLKANNYYRGEDYLNLTLEKVNRHWIVTDATVDKFRI